MSRPKASPEAIARFNAERARQEAEAERQRVQASIDRQNEEIRQQRGRVASRSSFFFRRSLPATVRGLEERESAQRESLFGF